MSDLGVVDLDMVDTEVIVAGLVELEVVGLVVRVVGENCLREMVVVDEDYLIKLEVVTDGCLLDDSTRFGEYHRLDFDH